MLIVLALLGVAFGFGWRQIVALRTLKALPLDEQRPARRQAWRRLVSCLLFLLMAISIAYSVAYLEVSAQKHADEREKFPDRERSPQERSFERLYIGNWIAVLTLLAVAVFITAWDLWSLRHRGALALQRLHDEQRALRERQAALRRRERGR